MIDNNEHSQLRVLIVDDEPPARKKIRAFLDGESAVASIEEAGNGVDAVRLIEEWQPDLVFLDIQMPGMTGFEVIEAVGIQNMPVVVFVTAYDQYAIEAFDVQAVDYLLKPFHRERFLKSFERVVSRVGESGAGSSVEEVKRVLEQVGINKKPLERIMVKQGPRYFFVKVGEIMHISAEEKYVKLHTMGESYLIRGTMSGMEERLDSSVFVRIH